MSSRREKWLTLFLLLVAGLLFVACDAGDEEGSGGGLTDETPIVTEEPMVPTEEMDGETPSVELTETPEVTVTVTEEITTAVTTEATEQATVEATEEATVEVTEEPTTGAEMEGSIVVRASELIGMGVNDVGTATEIGIVTEVLVDEAGAIQYVVIDVLPTPEAAETDEPGTGITDTTEPTQATPAIDRTTIAVAWDELEVSVDGMTQVDETEEITETNAPEAQDEPLVQLNYAGETALQEQPAFDLDILDEEGYVLDEQGDTEVTIPAEYVDLLQISDYGDYEIQNAEDEELGDGDDLLLDLTEGQVLYLITDVGGFLGIGANSVAIPWDALQLEVTTDGDTETELFRLDVTAETLEEAPTIELDDWTPDVEVDWDVEYRQYWQTDTNG